MIATRHTAWKVTTGYSLLRLIPNNKTFPMDINVRRCRKGDSFQFPINLGYFLFYTKLIIHSKYRHKKTFRIKRSNLSGTEIFKLKN